MSAPTGSVLFASEELDFEVVFEGPGCYSARKPLFLPETVGFSTSRFAGHAPGQRIGLPQPSATGAILQAIGGWQ